MDRRTFLKLLPLSPVVFLQGSLKQDYQPIGYIDARLHRCWYYEVLDKYTGEVLSETERILWADDRAGVYGRYKNPFRGASDLDIEVVKREIIFREVDRG